MRIDICVNMRVIAYALVIAHCEHCEYCILAILVVGVTTLLVCLGEVFLQADLQTTGLDSVATL